MSKNDQELDNFANIIMSELKSKGIKKLSDRDNKEVYKVAKEWNKCGDDIVNFGKKSAAFGGFAIAMYYLYQKGVGPEILSAAFVACSTLAGSAVGKEIAKTVKHYITEDRKQEFVDKLGDKIKEKEKEESDLALSKEILGVVQDYQNLTLGEKLPKGKIDGYDPRILGKPSKIKQNFEPSLPSSNSNTNLGKN